MANESLGKGECPCCGSPLADVKLPAKGLAYLVCNTCNVQVFARSARSDELLRDKIGKQALTSAPAPAPAQNKVNVDGPFGDQPDAVAKPPKAYKNPFMLG